MTVTIGGFDCVLADGVRETTQTTGTSSYQLDGASTVDGTTYRSFINAVGAGDRVPYVVWFGNEFERGLGTIAAGAPPTISRDIILGSSNGGSAVNWGPGQKDIWIDAPSELLDQIFPRPTLPAFAVAQSASGASVTFTDDEIANANKITVLLRAVGTVGVTPFMIRIGGSGGIETTGYVGTTARLGNSDFEVSDHSSGFLLIAGAGHADRTYQGHAVLITTGSGRTIWTFSSNVGQNTISAHFGGGSKSISSALTQVRVSTGSAETFDAGSFQLYLE